MQFFLTKLGVPRETRRNAILWRSLRDLRAERIGSALSYPLSLSLSLSLLGSLMNYKFI